jgi:hypothetical protein
MAAPRLRIGPRSRYWVILPLVRAATSQPRKVVPYLAVLVLYWRWIFLVWSYSTATMFVPMS